MKTLFAILFFTALTATVLMNTVGEKVHKLYKVNSKTH